MTDFDKDIRNALLGATFVFVIVFGVIFGVATWFHAANCHAQWAASGMPSSWGLVQGCLIQKKDGTWVPAHAYREIKGEVK